MTGHPSHTPLRERIREGTLLFDGGLGTMLLAKCRYQRSDALPCELLNLTEPSLVHQIHCEYLSAGADVLTTNTFCANRPYLARYQLADHFEEIICEAVKLARQAIDSTATGPARYIAGSVGPVLGSDGGLTMSSTKIYREQAAVLLAAGVDCIVLESFPTLDYAFSAIRGATYARWDTKTHVPLLLCFAPSDALLSLSLIEWQELGDMLFYLGCDMVGINCGKGPASCMQALDRLARFCDIPLLFLPSAGLPEETEQGLRYPIGPDEFASQLTATLERHPLAGIGGCCGTTPTHIAALRTVLSRNTAHKHPANRRTQEGQANGELQ